MNALSEFDSEFPSGSCPCGCRGNRELHEAFESGLTGEVGRQRRFPRRPPPRAGAARPATPRPRPKPGRRGPGRVYVREPYPAAYPDEPEPAPEPSQEPGSESNRWVQDCLNRVFGLSLGTTGVLDAASRSAIRRLQKQESLPITGIVSPGTEQALRRLCGEGDAPADPEWEGEWGESEWEGEISRSSPDYIRWVQASLNKILGLRLAVDGISGTATRSAVRSFQQQKGLTPDGIVGPQTEATLIAAGAAPPPQTSRPPAGTIPSGARTPDIVSVRGIQVARKIAPQVEALLAAAEGEGVRLSGWGYRSTARQIELRKQHCGTSDYDIYQKPASQCTPPTAPPGRSMHEQGLAIDFTYNGAGIPTQSNPGFQWLARNAVRFGLYNLPSEPWHWSVNGK